MLINCNIKKLQRRHKLQLELVHALLRQSGKSSISHNLVGKPNGQTRAKNYNATEVLEIIDRYSHMKKALGFDIKSLYANEIMVADYDNIGMQRGIGISDPTPKQAFRNKCILPERQERQKWA